MENLWQVDKNKLPKGEGASKEVVGGGAEWGPDASVMDMRVWKAKERR